MPRYPGKVTASAKVTSGLKSKGRPVRQVEGIISADTRRSVGLVWSYKQIFKNLPKGCIYNSQSRSFPSNAFLHKTSGNSLNSTYVVI